MTSGQHTVFYCSSNSELDICNVGDAEVQDVVIKKYERPWVVGMHICLLLIVMFCAPCRSASQDSTIDVRGFYDSAHHWYDISDEGKIIEPLPNQKRYAPSEVRAIADNILLFQKSNGGWPRNYDMLAVLTDEQRRRVEASRRETNTTFDNGATYTHVEYLARASALTNNARYREASLRGIEFILSAQYDNGGWPQFFPDTGGYRKYITFNDGAMIGVMRVLQQVVEGQPHFAFVDSTRRERVREAFMKGIECILRCQIEQNGERLAWGQQHDRVTFEPRKARSFELAAIANQESAEIVLFLMSLPEPYRFDGRIVHAVESAVRWFEHCRLTGLRVTTVSAPPATYLYHSTQEDLEVIRDSSAPPIWPRFSELGTHRALFASRDGKPVYSLTEVDRERRTGYAWYTYAPQEVLDRYRAWRAELSKRR